MDGWISLWRKIRNNSIWLSNEKFDKRSAFIDILLSTNYKDTKIIFDGKKIDVKAGEFITSMRGLAEKWKWSVTKVSNFLELLKSEEIIDYKKDSKKTLINVLKWELYQCEENKKVTLEEHRKDTEKNQKETDNKDNNNIYNNYIYNTREEKENYETWKNENLDKVENLFRRVRK